MPGPALSFSFEVRATVGAPQEIGTTRRGRRRIVPITGGTFEGASLRGVILPGGADYQLIQDDGFTELDSRYTLKADTGALVAVRNVGVRHAAPEVMQRLLAGERVDPALVYFRTSPRFETAAADLQWLGRSLFVGLGERYPDAVVIRYYRVE